MTQIDYIYVYNLRDRCIKGETIFFKDVPEHLFDFFWGVIERNSLLSLNEDFTGIVFTYKII